MRIALLTACLVSMAFGCSSSSSGDLTQRCMTACARSNTVCSAGLDCNASCTSATAMLIASRCASQAAAGYSCSEGLSDADLCGTTGLSMCSSQIAAIQACVSANTDAGMTDDAGM